MRFKKIKVISWFALLVLTACATKPVSAISGKEAIDGPIIVVKIDDTPDAHPDRKSTRLNSSHIPLSRMPSSA